MLRRYYGDADSESGSHYTDCFSITIDGQLTLADFVYAFYTTWLFKLERWILRRFVNKPSSDTQAREVANGQISAFAAWTVEDRNDNQLLMCDFQGRTRSWFMVRPDSDNPDKTQLFFGSAVIAVTNPETGRLELRKNYRRLMVFHKLYSIALLQAAEKKLSSQSHPP